MEISAREARGKISNLLTRAQKGEEIIITRHGKKVARLVPFEETETRLPDLSEFRLSISAKGDPLSESVTKARKEERY